MTIAFLTPEYPHPTTGNSGGLGTSIKNLAESLVALGHGVRLLVYAQPQDAVFEDQGIIIQQIKNIKFKGLSLFLTQYKIKKIIDQLHQNKQIDLVEATDWTGFTVFIQPKKCPMIIRLNGSDTYFCHLDQRPVKIWNYFLERRALQQAQAHLSVSAFTALKTNELFGLTIDFKIIPNGVNLQKFENPQQALLGKKVLYFGTLIRKKGAMEIPYIFNILQNLDKDTALVLVGKDSGDIKTGSSSTWALMKPLFDEEAFRKVQYLGPVAYNDIKKHIAEADVCIFPTFAEALPVSWLEAMAMKKAIVASNIGWATEVITNEQDGFLVHPQAHQAYAEAVLKLLNDKPLNQVFGENARHKIEKVFSNQVVAQKNVEFYQNYI
jgi:glycosyltransferase involved in cell wall biosynthesis